ncbi:MAG TPA: zf-HC2 domain-containing protein [Myxococcales bacterium]|nr:zf-HC2 domain-containing protein [Myxococcales bacterium]
MTALLPEELTCRQVVEVITDYLERRMSLKDRTRFEQHVVTCVGCTSYLRQMKQAIALAGAAKDPVDAKAQDELLRLFRGWKEKK